jgi:SOS-response transcriptional repressor LexA
MTSAQLALLRFIQGKLEATGIAPSYCEMRDGIGAKSKQCIADRLRALEEQGRIVRLRKRARAIEVLRPVSIPRDPDGRPLFFMEVPQ